MIDWDDIRYFLNAVRAGSYTAAADRLHVNRTTIGRRLTHLEEALGLSLYEQTEQGYRPSAAGQIVLESGRAMERIAGELSAQLAHLREAHCGVIRIAASAGIGVEFMPEILSFRALMPEVKVEMLATHDAMKALAQRKTDLAICLTAHRPGHLIGPRVCQVEQALYGSDAYLQRHRKKDGHDWICWGNEMGMLPERWIKANLRTSAGATLEVNSWAAMRQAVADGVGVAWLWSFAAETIDGLVRLKPASASTGTGLWLLHRADVPPDPATKALRDFLAQALARRCEAVDKKIL